MLRALQRAFCNVQARLVRGDRQVRTDRFGDQADAGGAGRLRGGQIALECRPRETALVASGTRAHSVAYGSGRMSARVRIKSYDSRTSTDPGPRAPRRRHRPRLVGVRQASVGAGAPRLRAGPTPP